MNTFSANDVIAQVNGLNTAKTLNRWRKIVEEHFGINYFRHGLSNNHSPVISYSLEDIKHFQFTAVILAGQPSNRKNLQQAIVTAFSSDKPFVKKKTEIEVLKDTVNDKIADLENEDKQLLVAIQKVDRKLTVLEKQYLIEKNGKIKLFRRK